MNSLLKYENNYIQMNKHCLSSISECQSNSISRTSEKLSKDLIDKMVKKYFKYVDKTVQIDQNLSSDDFSLSEISEGQILVPLKNKSKISVMKHPNNKKKRNHNKIQSFKMQPGVSKFKKLPLKIIKTKKILITKQKKSKLNIQKINHRFIPSKISFKSDTDKFFNEMIKHGLDKEISKICWKKLSPENVLRNNQLNSITLPSNSSQFTKNSHGENNNLKSSQKLFIFPYQRRNRSCSPENMELAISCLSKTPSAIDSINSSPSVIRPIIAKNFHFISQEKIHHTERSKDDEQILRALNINQRKLGEKEFIIETLDDDILEEICKPNVEIKLEAPKEILKIEQSKSIKVANKSKHRRVTSQVIDKKTVEMLLYGSKGNV